MHYVMDIHVNYEKKSGRAQEQPELGVHDEPKQYESKRQPKAVFIASEAPAQGPPAPPLPTLPDTQSVILDELIHLRQMMMSRFN